MDFQCIDFDLIIFAINMNQLIYLFFYKKNKNIKSKRKSGFFFLWVLDSRQDLIKSVFLLSEAFCPLIFNLIFTGEVIL